MVQITNDNFQTEILNASEAIVVFAQTASVLVNKTLDFLDTQSIKFGLVDFDEQRELVHKFNILESPTVLYFKSGRVRNKTSLVENGLQLSQLIENKA